ncbi:TPA: N-6 DNA methylase, partial [Klebsiella pneumoniae]|nr:N-6 DNA methylase [Klebsiella pneumoniae]
PVERKNKVLFINGVEYVTRERAHSRLSADNLAVLYEAYFSPENQEHITALVDFAVIKENLYNLSIPLYVQASNYTEEKDAEDALETWKINRIKLKKQCNNLFINLAKLGYEVREND